MRSKLRKLAPVWGDAAVAGECPQRLQQIDGLAVRAGGRRIEPAQLLRIAYAPVRQLECERCEIRFQDFSH